MFKKKARSFIIAALSAALILSGCGEATERADETTAETTSATTAKTLTDEELDEMAKNMPEIVFVMSHCLDNTNILGLYVTNKGDVKMYDFNKIAPDETYEIPDVYDRINEAYCTEIDFQAVFGYGNIMTENELTPLSENELTECYKTLIQINKSAEKKLTIFFLEVKKTVIINFTE